MAQHVLPGNPPVKITLRRSSRARRISLRVSRLDGRVTLTLPRYPQRDAPRPGRPAQRDLDRGVARQDMLGHMTSFKTNSGGAAQSL